mgnify:FL=1
MSPGKALTLALTAHKGQKDKAGRPIIQHVLRVAAAVAPFGESAMMVALLHDAIEDSDIHVGELWVQGFPPEVIQAVDTLTHRKGEDYMAYIRRVINEGGLALTIKRADNLDNADEYRLSMLPDAKAEELRKRYQTAAALLF